MAGWKKFMTVAAVLGLLVGIWAYFRTGQVSDDIDPAEEKSLEREKLADELAEVYIDEAAALEREESRHLAAKVAAEASSHSPPKAPVPAVHLSPNVVQKANDQTLKLSQDGDVKMHDINVNTAAVNVVLAGEVDDVVRAGDHPAVGATTTHVSSHSSHRKPFLPIDIVNRVEKFVFFIGYQRSGHSIIGSFMDAHPHMVIAHEFMLFNKLKEMDEKYKDMSPLRNKEVLFNELYQDSCTDAERGWRSGQLRNKNYTLTINSQWQGRYDRHIQVIGDKSGGATTTVYTSSPLKFEEYLNNLKKTTGIPVKVLHVVRNPYDMIATDALYSEGKRRRAVTGERQAVFVSNFKNTLSELKALGKFEQFNAARLNNQTLIESRTKSIVRLANGNKKIIQLIGEKNVLELHNMDLVKDPIATLTRICEFLNLYCSHSYLKACAEKVFKTVSNTRELVVWTESTRKKVDDLISQHSFLRRYSFDSD